MACFGLFICFVWKSGCFVSFGDMVEESTRLRLAFGVYE